MTDVATLKQLIVADARRSGLTTPRSIANSLLGLSPFWLVVLYRAGHHLRSHRIPVIPTIVRALGSVLWGAELWPDATFGPGLVIAHANGIVVGSGVVAGANCTLFSGVVLGSSSAHMRNGTCEPVLGSDVTVFAHAVVVGGTTIPDGSIIRAGSVVFDDTEPNQL